MDSPWTAKNWECCLGITDFCTVYPGSCLPILQMSMLKILLNFLIIILMIRNIVIKAIDLWCKPDTPEDNFEEDGSGWGSGDEVLQ